MNEPLVSQQTERTHIISALLKTPSLLMQHILDGRNLWRDAVTVLCCGLLFHALYGFAVGLFGGWPVAIMTAAKAPLIACGALVVCLPSLYVFACLGGLPVSLAQAFMLAASTMALTGLLLLGLAPVAWLFAVSTNSLGFTVSLNLVIWLIAFGTAASFLRGTGTGKENQGHRRGLGWWIVIYLLVTFQMTTLLRPILTPPSEGWWTAEKKFFIVHFTDCFTVQKK